MKNQCFLIILFVALAWTSGFGQFLTNGSTIVYTTDNVGVGISTPDANLHVNGSTRIGDWLRVGGNTDGFAWKMGLTGSLITRNGDVVLGAASTDKIGIGIATPNVKLHVAGDSRISGFLSLGGNTDGASWKLGVSGNVITRNGKVVLGAAATDKIGLGTVNPDVKLHVVGDSRITGFLRVGGNTDGNVWKMGVSGSIITRNGNVILGAASTDKIGLGTTSPTAKLHVYGDAMFEMPGTVPEIKIRADVYDPVLLPSVGYFGQIGLPDVPFYKLYASSIYRLNEYTLSDASMKNNVSTIQNATSLINRLRGVRYDLMTNKLPGMTEEAARRIEGKNQLGFIAQEVKEVLPELVVTEDATGLNMVNYEGVIPVLVEAFQEQSKRIEEKDEIIAELEEKVTTLEARLDKIEKLLAQQPIGERSETTLHLAVKEQTSMSVYPNPGKGNLTVKFEPLQSGRNASVVILGLDGREIARQNIENGATQVEFNLASESAGTYVCQMVADGKVVATEKVVIVK